MLDSLIRFEKRCPVCSETKPVTEFPRNRATADGRGGYCLPCHNGKVKAYARTPEGRAAKAASNRRSTAKRRARYEAELAALSPEDRTRLGR